MAVVALTNIKHDDQWVDAGTEVAQDDFEGMTDEQWQALVDSEAVGTPVLSSVEAEAMTQEQLDKVDKLLQEKYGLTLADVLATEDTGGGAGEGPSDGV